MKADLQKKGFEVDEEKLATRSKKRKTLAELERAANEKMLEADGASSDDNIEHNPNEELK